MQAKSIEKKMENVHFKKWGNCVANPAKLWTTAQNVLRPYPKDGEETVRKEVYLCVCDCVPQV